MNEDVIELWLDEYFEGEDDHEASYDKLCHELTIDDDGGFRGTVANGYLYVFVFKDNKGVVTEDFGNGNHLGGKKFQPPPNPTVGRILDLSRVGYVVDIGYSGSGPSSLLDSIILKHPSNIGFLKIELHRDGSLSWPHWEDHEDEFHIAPEDFEGFSEFVRSVRVPTMMDKIFPSG